MVLPSLRVQGLASPAVMLAVNWLSPHDLIQTFGTIGLLLDRLRGVGDLSRAPPGRLAARSGRRVRRDQRPQLATRTSTSGSCVIGSFLVAVLGAEVGYYIGRTFGPRLFKPGARFFKTEYLERGESFFERRGSSAVVLARFVPIVRTIVPMVAGTTRMKPRTFFVANVIGAALWAVGVTMLGYWIGKSINIDHYIYPIVAIIIVLSLIPPFLEYRRHRKTKAEKK